MTSPDLTSLPLQMQAAFTVLLACITAHPEVAIVVKGQALGTAEYCAKLADKFAQGRMPKGPKAPATMADDMIGVVLHHYFEVPLGDLSRIQREHALSMGAENIVGDLLERYIAAQIEPLGWVWCSGASLRAIDFIKPPMRKGRPWLFLQVKNRDNSENSSSSAIRDGTPIQKWHRSFSKKVGSNWHMFPDDTARTMLSEQGFKQFAQQYLQALRA